MATFNNAFEQSFCCVSQFDSSSGRRPYFSRILLVVYVTTSGFDLRPGIEQVEPGFAEQYLKTYLKFRPL